MNKFSFIIIFFNITMVIEEMWSSSLKNLTKAP